MAPERTPNARGKPQVYEVGAQRLSETELEDGIICFENDPIMTLEVGPGKSLFHVHKSLICHVSPFFDAAFNGAFKENCGSMQLAEDDPSIFEILVQWLYKRKLVTSPAARKNIMVYYSALVDVYLLADKYGMVPLKDFVVKCFFDRVKKHRGAGMNCGVPDTEIVSHAYANTVAGSCLRRFLVTCWAWGMDLDKYGLAITPDDILKPPEFAADLAIALALRARRGIEADAFKDLSPFLESTNSKPNVDDGRVKFEADRA
ncbi:MAG: hypothetical protein LQ338_008158 [Usnochroma carphineum]|nr:MAG: hypothetical protein LQ338_008158 [Usnochroma carphineum]